jgi:uncharacterized protein (DUF1800 family)
MMLYLNNAESTKANPNENYARELMELHTLGRLNGYVEADVHKVALLLTGRGVGDWTDRDTYHFDPAQHHVGAIRAAGFSTANASANAGEAAGDAFVRYLAHHPNTAKHLMTKLATRFVSDTPSAALVSRLTQVYLANDTAIIPVLKALVTSTEFWSSRGQKVRRPAENVVAAIRAVGATPGADVYSGLLDMSWGLTEVNDSPLTWRAPNGLPDHADEWVSSGSMTKIWLVHRGVIDGWYCSKALMLPKVEQLWGGHTPATYGAAVDALSVRLVGQKLPTAQRQALLTFLGAADGTRVTRADLNWQLNSLAPLLFDSIFHALR